MTNQTSSKPVSPRKTEVTIKDIALKLGMSHATVSRALNDHPSTSPRTKILVREAASALGYVRNTNALTLQGAASRLIGFIAPDIQNEFYAIIAKVLAEKCSLAGYQLALSISEDDPELEYRHILAMRQARATGVLITPTANILQKTVKLLEPVPALQLIRSHPLLDRTWVGIDDFEGVRMATAHMLKLGHRRIGYVGGSAALNTGRNRYNGYAQALAAGNVSVDESIVMLGAPRPAFGNQATLALMEKGITGLVIGGAQLTLGALQAIQRLKLTTPREVSIIGYTDPEWFDIWGPGLTTVGLPVQDIAAAAAENLFEEINPITQTRRKDIIFKPDLIIRGSVREA